ncbi:MAG: SdrD B-like domain-containing protein [Candidatus Latescibacterota bacterium]
MRGRKHILYYSVIPILLSLLLLGFACSEDPTRVKEQNDPGGFTGSGEVDPGASGSFLLGTVSDTTFSTGHIAVWANNVVFDESTGICSIDVVLLNAMRTPIPAPIHFVITSIFPSQIAVVDFDGVTADDLPFYDFSSKLGADFILGAGEQSGPVTMKFHTVTARSFSIGFRIDIGPPQGRGKIVGVVFQDNNRNGFRDRCKDDGVTSAPLQERCEYGIPGITVGLMKGPFEDHPEEVIFITRTNESGEYMFYGLREGVYTLRVHVDPNQWEITSSNPLLVTLVVGPDGKVMDFFGANFGLYPMGGMGEQTLFGPIIIGPITPHGALLDTMFVDPPSMLPVVFHYFLEALYPPYGAPIPTIIDTASVWINGVQVFAFSSSEPPDSVFTGELVKIPQGVVRVGPNDVRLYVGDNEFASLYYRIYKKN